jgi:parallel beta-helix repeat protein
MIENNTAQKDGGGIYCWAGTNVVVTNCIITGNMASLNGGGISFQSCTPVVSGCTITGNTSAGAGGGIHSWKSGVGTDYTTVCSNTPDQIFGPWIDNVGNCVTEICDSDGDGAADCIDGCPDDPDKVDPGQCGCGNPDTDSDGDGTADCIDGCPDDPNKIEPGECGCGVPDEDTNDNGIIDCLEIDCPADIDGDGLVAIEDLLMLLSEYGDCPTPCDSDINGDGSVSIDDLLELISAWGPCE